MRLKRTAVLWLILTISWTAYSQPGTDDSTRLYSAPIWKVRRLVHDAGLKAHCDSVNRYLENELHKTKVSLAASNSLEKELETSRNLWRERSEAKTLLLQNTEKQHEIDLKVARKKSRKVGFIAGIGVLVLVEAVRLFTP